MAVFLGSQFIFPRFHLSPDIVVNHEHLPLSDTTYKHAISYFKLDKKITETIETTCKKNRNTNGQINSNAIACSRTLRTIKKGEQ